jgi:uncharacterized protein (TIGR03118 family)
MLASRLARLAVFAVVAAVALAAAATAGAASSSGYIVTPLVSTDGSNGTKTDGNLVNSWGLGASSSSPWWVADNGTGVSTLYTGAGAINPLVVTVGDNPTGLVFNTTTGFPLPTGGNARFLFDSEAGAITGWNGGTASQAPGVDLSTDGAVFKGLAIANTSAGPRLYATDFHNRRVDVFDGAWQPVHAPFQFFDPTIPRSFAPFGIQTIGSLVYVTYAKTQPGSNDEAHGTGLGFVDAFDAATGILRSKVAIRGLLNAPWGLALAPAGFGELSGDLLVGNFGDGHINAYRPFAGGHIYLPAGQLRTAAHMPVAIDGLWALEFGNGAAAGPVTSLYFTAGPNDENAGLFGSITAAP